MLRTSLLCVAMSLPGVAFGSTITVTRVDDPAPDGCTVMDCSLREAVLLANALSGADTIVLPAGNYQLTRSGSDDTGQLGDLDSSGPLEIDGAGPAQSIIVSTVTTRILQTSADLILRHLAVQSGTATGSGVDGRGGGVYVGGRLTLQDVEFSGNHADEKGGAVYQRFDIPADGDATDILRIDASTFDGNAAGGDGGAVYQMGSVRSSSHPDAIFVSGSTFSNNTASGGGGALYSVPNSNEMQPVGAHLLSSAFTDNSAQKQGGAVLLTGNNPQVTYTIVDALVEDCTFSGNHGSVRAGALGFGSNVVGEYGVVHGTVVLSTFENNQVLSIASGDARGGAMSSPELVRQSTIKNNHAYTSLGVAAGGAIDADDVAVVDSLLQGNTANTRGGAIASGTLRLRRTLLAGNSTNNASNAGKGGGVYLEPTQFSAAAQLLDSTLSSNASNSGGALYVLADANWQPDIEIIGTSMVTNSATLSGGAIRTDHRLDVVNSTFDGNTAPTAGGILLFLTAAGIRNSTLVGDSGGTGNVLYQNDTASATAAVVNTIIRGTCQFAGSATALAASYDIESPGNTCGLVGGGNAAAVSEANLALGALQDNGGPTPTRLPGTLSYARNTGTSTFGYCPAFDQRGYVRSPAAPCDIGATELDAVDDVVFRDNFQI